MSKKEIKINVGIALTDRKSQHEIADILGISKTAVNVIALHALIHLYKQIEESQFEEIDVLIAETAHDILSDKETTRVMTHLPDTLIPNLEPICTRTNLHIDVLCIVALRWFIQNWKESNGCLFANLLPVLPEPKEDTGGKLYVSRSSAYPSGLTFDAAVTIFKKHGFQDALDDLISHISERGKTHGWHWYVFGKDPTFRNNHPDAVSALTTEAPGVPKHLTFRLRFKDAIDLLKQHGMHKAVEDLVSYANRNKSPRGWNSYVFAGKSSFKESYPEALRILTDHRG